MIIQTRITDPDEMELFINSAKNCGYVDYNFNLSRPSHDVIKINLWQGHYSHNNSSYHPFYHTSEIQHFLVRPVKYFEDIEVGDTVEYLKPINYHNPDLTVGNYYKVKKVLHNNDIRVKGIARAIPQYFLDVVEKDPVNIQKRKDREEAKKREWFSLKNRRGGESTWYIHDEVGRLTPEMIDWASRYTAREVVQGTGIYEQARASGTNIYMGTLTREMLDQALNSLFNPPTHDRNSDESLGREVGEGMGDQAPPGTE